MSDTPPEFSRPVRVERIPPDGLDLAFEASEAERTALAVRFGVDGLDRFAVEVALSRRKKGAVRLSGRITARVRQTCVVTLTPLTTEIEVSFALTYAPADGGRDDAEIEIDPARPDPPEPIEDGVIDVGEAASEQLGLEIDPFPRHKGASFTPPLEPNETGDDAPPHPFAALARLKGRDG